MHFAVFNRCVATCVVFISAALEMKLTMTKVYVLLRSPLACRTSFGYIGNYNC